MKTLMDALLDRHKVENVSFPQQNEVLAFHSSRQPSESLFKGVRGGVACPIVHERSRIVLCTEYLIATANRFFVRPILGAPPPPPPPPPPPA